MHSSAIVLPILVVVIAAVCGTAFAQYGVPLPYVHQSLEPAPIHEMPDERLPAASLAHPAAIETAERESRYPADWTNDQYKNPRIAAALAKESWFTDKEMPVFNRVADTIPREQVFKLFKNAGFIRRR